MTKLKRCVGRPKGSEKDDGVPLAAIADLVFDNPSLKPTSAMHQLYRRASDADVRRWQAKWKERKEFLLAEAEARAQERRRQADTRSVIGSNPRASAVGMAAMGLFPHSSLMKMAIGIDHSPGMKALLAYQNSPAMRAMREIQNSPAMRAMRLMQDSPAMRAIRVMQDSPAMRIMRQHHELLGRFSKLTGQS